MARIFALVAFTSCSIVSSEKSAVYTLEVTNLWTNDSYPKDYPSNAHWSPLVIVSRGNAYTMSKLGEKASGGLQSVAETGARETIHTELEEQKKSGSVKQALGTVEKLVVNMDGTPRTWDVQVDEEHPWIEVVTMVAPSPDWYAFASVNLFQSNAFINMTEEYAFGYDAGTDQGVTYKSDNAPNDPQGTISSLANVEPFNKAEVQLLKLRFVKKDGNDDDMVSASLSTCYPSIFQVALILFVARYL